MKTTILALSCALLASGGLAAGSSPAFADDASPKGVSLKKLEAGTVFVFKRQNASDETITIRAMDGLTIQYDSETSRRKQQREAVGFAVFLDTTKQTMTESDRSLVAQLFPLKVGNKVVFFHSETGQSGSQRPVTDKAEVVSAETLTVAAGTFETFVIKTEMQNGDWWGKRTCWYAPEVGYCAKIKWQSVRGDDFENELASIAKP